MKHNNNTLFNTPSPRCLRTRPLPQGARKTTPRGFTLIELLVVVLIIGILAAVAVPQYKKAVVKSRLAAIKPILDSIKKTQEIYYLQNGTYLDGFTQLDLSFSCPYADNKTQLKCDNYFFIDNLMGSEKSGAFIVACYCPGQTNWSNCINNRDFEYRLYLNHSTFPNQILCIGQTDLGKSICKAEGL